MCCPLPVPPEPAVPPTRVVVVAANPILNVLPIVPPLIDFPTPSLLPGDWSSDGIPCPENQPERGQETFLITLINFCRNSKAGPKEPGVARFQVYVT